MGRAWMAGLGTIVACACWGGRAFGQDENLPPEGGEPYIYLYEGIGDRPQPGLGIIDYAVGGPGSTRNVVVGYLISNHVVSISSSPKLRLVDGGSFPSNVLVYHS